uniref:Protein kinase domain-containing protein n=1 Tax=viral metagenome TaxID=1070528 RepID=A0A6C0AQE5_9ZZZZ
MINVHYQKRKNGDLFKCLENPNGLFLSDLQNYIPIYTKFFSLNETNYNNINLNHPWCINFVNDTSENNDYIKIYNCKLKNYENDKVKHKDVFFKLAPLLDPYKYLIGKYNILDPNLFNLPKIETINNNYHPKFMDTNNAAYVDGLFIFLTSKLLEKHNFIHGVDYYGSFLGIKNNFTLNVFDDIDYLNNSDFFNKNKNSLFKIDNYEHLFQNETQKLKPINIQHDISAKSMLSIKSFDNEIFENIFEENANGLSNNVLVDLENIVSDNILNNDDKTVTLRSSSTCSSRSSHTSIEDDKEDDNEHDKEYDDEEDEDEEDEDEEDEDEEEEDEEEEDEKDEDEEHDEDEDEEEEEETINVSIPKFPVQVICMENCENTFDDLILNSDLTKEEWYSAFMQIIMILITYQKAFNFTHNDLHTNNVMYIQTNKKFIYYCYKKKHYKVPTFGRLFKIIDFGRSIYKFNGKIFCSDSFQIGGDAATQYNTEPYLNDKKPRLEPNYSFDLCRLACSIFDYLVDDIEEVKDLSKCDDPIKRLIVEWCLDDKGINMLYKNNGTDRYPDFKLYKMISRCVHNHTPQAQLDRPEFNAFSKFKGDIPSDVINIDNISVYV